jgi:predicted O-methyltransferase YrrM
VEIGVAEGASAALLRRAMAPDGCLWLVDPFHLSRNPLFNTGFVAARRTVGRVNRGEVKFVVASSLEAAQSWREHLDFVFIDADHGYQSVMADWRAWSPYVDPGGLVVFHDAIRKPRHPEGPAAAVDALFRVGRREGWKVVDEIDTLVVVERPSV